MRRFVAVTVGALALAADAHAAGGPVPPLQGGAGVSASGAPSTYQAVRGGPHATVVVSVVRGTGEIGRTRLVKGDWGVPGVTYDGRTTGLSADGRTLVLAEMTRRYPVRRTRLLRLSTKRLDVRDRITLPGMWNVDAISPDGRWLYLLHYKGQDVVDYEVRAYDLRRGRLVRAPIVDKREPDEQMGGVPLTRTESADGRWAYTFYDGPHGPFIHALDTTRREAACIDLDDLRGADLSGVRLQLSVGSLTVTRASQPLATVDTRTFAVREGGAPRGWFGGILQAAALLS